MGMENVLQAQRNAAHVKSCSFDAPIGIFFGFKILPPPLIAGFQIISLKCESHVLPVHHHAAHLILRTGMNQMNSLQITIRQKLYVCQNPSILRSYTILGESI